MLADKSEKKCLYPLLSTSLTSSPKGGSCTISPLERKELQHETMLSASNSREGNKQSAFTLAELMIIMSVMTVVIAAIAPIFTARLANASFDNVWSVVGASNMNDIYTDAPVRSMMQEVMIGVTPVDMEDVRRTYQPYSKLVVRSSNQISGNKIQKQIEFKHRNTASGYLLAGNSNLLLGGKYNDISFSYVPPDKSDITRMIVGDGASGNTAMGANSLNSLTTGKDNSAFGYQALSSVTTGSQNTAIGVQAGLNLTTGSGNTIIGYNSYNAATGNYNTVIGNNTASKSTVSNYTTAVGNNINVKGDYNTAIGDSSNAGGSYNTAIGYGALESANPSSDSYSNFKNNTAIGYKSCSGISSSAQNTTCVGGKGIDSTIMNSTAQGFFNDTHNRVLIGRGSSKYGSAATLEVHTLDSTNSKYPYPDNISGASNLGDSSVVVNGNLIVRGQVFLNGRSPFPMQPTASSSYSANTISLMGYRLYKEAITDHKPLIGLDGNEHFRKMSDDSDNKHESVTAREHCICAYSCSTSSKDYANSKGFRGRDSYDWFSRSRSNSHISVTNTFGNQENYYYNSHYCGSSYNADSHSAYNYELNKAHITTNAGYNNASQIDSSADKSCCPMLSPSGNQFSQNISSDIRLKNIESPFNDGIFMLSKLNIYNYTFKADNNKTPNVGVIAQNLKRVFPDSVSKDEKGYYKIRTDEMFYAAINAVKELNQNIAELASKINNYIVRISKLKKENKELQNQLIMLSKQLDELEK